MLCIPSLTSYLIYLHVHWLMANCLPDVQCIYSVGCSLTSGFFVILFHRMMCTWSRRMRKLELLSQPCWTCWRFLPFPMDCKLSKVYLVMQSVHTGLTAIHLSLIFAANLHVFVLFFWNLAVLLILTWGSFLCLIKFNLCWLAAIILPSAPVAVAPSICSKAAS